MSASLLALGPARGYSTSTIAAQLMAAIFKQVPLVAVQLVAAAVARPASRRVFVRVVPAPRPVGHLGRWSRPVTWAAKRC